MRGLNDGNSVHHQSPELTKLMPCFQGDSEYAPSGCVSFLTIHQSMVLEFPIVVVGSANKLAILL